MRSRLFFVLFLFIGLQSFAQNGFSLQLDAVKIAYDGKRDLIYAITTGRDLVYGNSLVAINPSSGQVEKSLFIGSEPNCMVFTSDTNYLYVSFNELALVKRIDLSTYLVDKAFGVGSSPTYGVYFGNSLATIPNENNIVVVSRVRKNVSPDFAGLAVYKDGVELPKTIPDHTGPSIICSTGKDTIYGSGSGSFGNFYAMRINKDSGAYMLSVTTTNISLNNMMFDDGFLYGSNGYVVDTRYNPAIPYGRIIIDPSSSYLKAGIAPDASNNKIFTAYYKNDYANTNIQFQSFDAKTLVKNNTLLIPMTIKQGYSSPTIKELIRFGKYGMATILYEDYYFGTNLAYLVVVNNHSFVDTAAASEPKKPTPIWYDTVVVNVYDTIHLQTNDTLVFPMFKSTGTTEELLATFRIYPNPTSEYLTIETPIPPSPNSQAYFFVSINDMEGKQVVATNIYMWGGALYVGDLAKGYYVLDVWEPNSGKRIQKSIVVN